MSDNIVSLHVVNKDGAIHNCFSIQSDYLEGKTIELESCFTTPRMFSYKHHNVSVVAEEYCSHIMQTIILRVKCEINFNHRMPYNRFCKKK